MLRLRLTHGSVASQVYDPREGKPSEMGPLGTHNSCVPTLPPTLPLHGTQNVCH